MKKTFWKCSMSSVVAAGMILSGIVSSSFASKAYYLSPSGSDDNAGSKDAPYHSLSKAVTVMEAGDTCWVKGGTYNCDSTVKIIGKKGTATARYYILAVSGEKPVFDYSAWTTTLQTTTNETVRGVARGIFIDSTAHYWYFKGLQISNCPDNGVKIEGSFNTFDQCIFDHNGDGGVQIGLSKDDRSSNVCPEIWAAYNTIINCDAYRNADWGTEYENADGFSCKCYAGIGNLFYGCRAWENSDDGWDCYQTDYQIYIINCWAWHNGDPTMWGFTTFNGDGNGFKLGGNGSNCPIMVRNCIAFNAVDGTPAGDGGGSLIGFTDNNNSGQLIILNCIAWQCKYDFKVASPAPELRNNAAFAPTHGDSYTFVNISSDAVLSNNTAYGEDTATGLLVTAADLVDTSEAAAGATREADGGLPKNGFGRLKSTSGLINKGYDIGIVYDTALTGVDFGIRNTIIGVTDIGAYEYGSNELPTVPSGIFVIPNGSTTTATITSSRTTESKSFIASRNGSLINVRFTASESGSAVMKLFDVMGKEVATLFDGMVLANHDKTVSIDSKQLTNGTYFCILKNGQQKNVAKLLIGQ